jgi:hypothetical protein
VSEVTVSTTEFAAFKADVDERFENLVSQLAVINGKITDLQTSTTIADFPDEEAQVRETVLTSFDDEITTLLADINKLKSDVVTIQQQLNII